MKQIMLSSGHIAKVSNRDRDWLAVLGNWSLAPARGNRDGYAYCRVREETSYRHVAMHRAVAIQHGLIEEGSRLMIGFKDDDSLNCQISNLRVYSRSQQAAGRSKIAKGTSAYKGVSWDGSNKKYRAVIYVKHQRRHLGWFGNARNAALAYNKAAKKHFGKHAKLNKVSQEE